MTGCRQNETIVMEGTGRGKVAGWRASEQTTFTVMLLHAYGKYYSQIKYTTI